MSIYFDGFIILNKMSIRCKVCNTTKIVDAKTNSHVNWECQTCGNTVDAHGNVVSLD
ncbi:MAG: hypothetical protein OEL56_04005 [Nitrosopumilus sp.]|nr:hypothetical protein [Nitrosopumilus sp.]MDH3489591.1 hypothetical protein [Nitrosopumilus sp.]MDH3516589.1 hypothetical protein [Nitrosopumilus sp.]MDH3565056.1 hypothetical protein [Nitrosopumilus sp.]MDH5416479.1 hypothetical protein [Nitrosopumilus sp.]